jgi:hypothetical protein
MNEIADSVNVSLLSSNGTEYAVDADGNLQVADNWIYGEPTLLCGGAADAVWSRGNISPYFQKSSTGWLADLYGGTQSGDDYASVVIPINELPTTSFNSAQWSYYMTNAEAYGVNMVIWIHDPTDFDKRAEVTQAPSGATLEKGSGWNAHELDTSTTQFFFYGENTGSPDTCETAGTQYTWAQFQADSVFSTWTIYRITFEMGWYSSGVFEDVWVADIKLNGKMIPLKPDSSGTGRIGHRHYTVSDSAANTLAPKTPFRLLSVDCEISVVGTTSESLTITKDSGLDDAYDTLVYSINTLTSAVTSLFAPFGEGYDFEGYDELDMAWPNTEDRELGFTWTYQTVF